MDPDELAELAREEAEHQWREDMCEVAMGCRAYAAGDWTIDDYLEWSPVGRGYAAAHERSTFGMTGL